MECTVMRLLTDGDRIAGAVAYWRESGRLIVPGQGGGAGHRRHRQGLEGHLELLGVHRRRHALALWAGADLIDMEFVQFHPTGMVWPPSVRGILVTEGVRGDGGVLRNAEGERFMFDYIPEMFRAETAETEEEADRWYDDRKNSRAPTCSTRSPGPSTPRSRRAGRPRRGLPGHRLAQADRLHPAPPALDVPPVQGAADVDITREPMEVGPTCHYVMGGVRVDADTQAATDTGARRWPPRACAANRLGVLYPTCWSSACGPGATPPSAAAAAASRPPTRPRSRRPSAGPGPLRAGRRRREPLPSSMSCGTACRSWSASSAPRAS